VQQVVPIVQVLCRFGGSRPYFECPGVVKGVACGRRAAKLYDPAHLFLCRHCYRLAYATQGMDKGKRALRKANRIRLRLGGEPGMLSLFPPKPRGMWWKTYERLRAATDEADLLGMGALTIRAERIVAGGRRRTGRRAVRTS
jgi:hypothetical protein